MIKKLIQLSMALSVCSVSAQTPFEPLLQIDETPTVVLPQGLSYTILFAENDTIYNRGHFKALAKGNHDYNVFISDSSSEKGLLFVSHETNSVSDLLGDGGGATVMEIEKRKEGWVVPGKKFSVDFSQHGGTYKNCSGVYTSKGTILSAEEFPPESNKELYQKGKGFRDTSDFNKLKRWQNMGWMVEVDPIYRRSLRKLYKMGRFSHEAALVMPDKKTVYLTDDYVPSIFFKFECANENDFSDGKLYAYVQSDDGKTGGWLDLPMDMNSLLDIRNVAIKEGASMFARMEWITMVDGLIYITETGSDNFILDKEIQMGGKPALHFNKYKTPKGGYDYPYGSVLVFDPTKKSMKPFINGGAGVKDPVKHFSNPDGIASVKLGNKTFLVINEDINGTDKGRSVGNSGKATNEIWWLDLSIKSPTVDNLQRFMVAPLGAETTGGYFTPDGSTYFVNIQHPDKGNFGPFNRSTTIAITGFKWK